MLLSIVAGYFLDLLFGDPQWRWHPVRLVGGMIECLERILNTDKINKKFAGVMLAVLVVCLTAFFVWGILEAARFIHPILYYAFSALFIYFSLSVRSLAVEAKKVYSALNDKDIVKARRNLSMIVARDTDTLEQPEIIRASVETVAESITDGIIAPLFYAFVGGPVLMWAYKATNTLDSMVGYRNERFIEFGRPAAKLDGLANLIPAKITCFLISVSSLLYRKDWLNSIRWGLRYLLKGPEKNSEATEAAMAGALAVQLGGINFYNSMPVPKPLIGDNYQPLEIRHIPQSAQIAYLCSGLFLLIGVSLLWLIGRG